MKRSRWTREATIFAGIVGAVVTIIAFGAFSSAGTGDVHGIAVPHVIVTGSTAGPLFEAINSGKGPGLEGISKKGTGVVGVTKFESTTQQNGRAGVEGDDTSTFGAYNTGVLGTSTNRVGVTGVSLNGLGMSGTSSTDNGVAGFSTGGNGVSGTSTYSAGVFGISVNGNGVVGEVDGTGPANGVLGEDTSSITRSNAAVKGVSNQGFGIWAESQNNGGVGIFAMATGVNSVGIHVLSNGQALPLWLQTAAQASVEMAITDYHNFIVLDIDDQGNIITSGKIYTGGSCSVGCIAPGGAGRRVRSYETQASSPTIEDYGQGRLIDGQAYVHVDAKFANVIDRTSNYLVFITPEGDSRGLYVDQKTSAGFFVHENQGGRSTLNFTYRIAARPFGSKETRLPMVEMKRATRLPIPPHSVFPASKPHR